MDFGTIHLREFGTIQNPFRRVSLIKGFHYLSYKEIEENQPSLNISYVPGIE